MKLVIAEMSRWENCHIFLMGGGKKERDLLDPIMRRYPNVLSLPHIKHSFAKNTDWYSFAMFSACYPPVVWFHGLASGSKRYSAA